MNNSIITGQISESNAVFIARVDLPSGILRITRGWTSIGSNPIRRGVKRSDVEGAINHKRDGQK